ncbi:UDP-N-acetylmuramoyl-L-alanyl-D-glutamate--2,6-diaminopimelate ligase [Sulfobacillus harzensis]|uniref:UDP-N-acetylmuramyl-tripeptide synthetase n=1 Tax=Sulfobacillus harzensis TaxID=2729629 RepID=A0A7Y0Q529_9FIRM|nr:UDP-N-acetylmuramoyl-L-alanyl-D-glutamate--2,6-diaminopimelate ligase [Sulfobacillus harzensis]NMP25025.1 UDP-N-acetylmuramoyl-L-alanyl-D-glutamate--2,6-diaminopimelate ligase [Sulfobacillus harzensis]
MAAGITKTGDEWRLSDVIQGVAIDSRLVKPGYIFVAIPGAISDGHAFVEDAINRGAVAIVGEHPLNLPVPYFQVESSRRAAAELSAAYYHYPSRDLVTIGVTGTNGKTSVVYWLTALVRAGGISAGMISSVVNDTGNRVRNSILTTPESPELQRQLWEMRQNGATHAVVEVSSHGIAQRRVDEIGWDLAVLTNITREHLDFHGTMENYVATKAKLFQRLPADSLGAVLNADNRYSDVVREGLVCPVVTYGLEAGDVRTEILEATAWGSRVRIDAGQGRPIEAQLNHPGQYNVYNLTAAVTAALALGVSPEVIQRVIPELPGVPGRMQVLQQPGQPTVIVDYAHTPDGLTQSLITVRKMVEGRVWLVFGARGGRDRGKRPEMGRVAATLADCVVLTADSPNDEEPDAIAEAIREGIDTVDPAKLIKIELDRARAIHWVVKEAQATDCVLITGRGPEPYQYFHGRRVVLKDSDVALDALGERVRKGADGVGIH